MNQKTKMVVLLVGNTLQASIAVAYIKENKISNDELYAMAPILSVEEIKGRLKSVQYSSTDIKVIMANNLVKTSEENLADLEEFMLSQKSMTLNFEIQRIYCSDYTFIVKAPKPEVHVPKKVGIVNTKAKGKFRQKPLGITRPYMS